MKIIKLGIIEITKHRKELKELLRICFKSTYDKEAGDIVIEEKYLSLVEHVNADTAYVLGALVDDSLIGFLWGYPIKTPFETVFHIAYLAVFEQGRNKGIGSQLLCEAERQAVELGIGRIELIVGTTNDIAEAFYENSGYQVCRNVMSKSVSSFSTY